MFPCPLCGASGRTRTSVMMNDGRTIRKTWYQCNNIECGVGFYTLESFAGLTGRNQKSTGIPWENLPASHRGHRQMDLLPDEGFAGEMQKL